MRRGRIRPAAALMAFAALILIVMASAGLIPAALAAVAVVIIPLV